MGAFGHRGPWYRQRSPIIAPMGGAQDVVLCARNHCFFETVADRVGGIPTNPALMSGEAHG